MKIKDWSERLNKTDNNFIVVFERIGVVERSDGTQHRRSNSIYHIRNDQYHNENGPAIEYGDGRKRWWLNGISYAEKEWKIEVEKLKKKNGTLVLK